MQLHPPIFRACELAIDRIVHQGEPASIVVEKSLKSNKKWGARDRRHFAEVVYEVVRWWRRLEALSDHSKGLKEDRLISIRNAIDTYTIFKLHPEKFEKQIERMDFVEKESIPDWLNDLGRREVGENWPQLLSSLNLKAKQFLRVNTLKTQPQKVVTELNSLGIETDSVLGLPEALVLRERKNVFITDAYKNGFFEMQDGGSQMIAPFLQVKPGQRVIDACAGAGGKTLHLAALMQNQGQIVALDIHAGKLEELKKRARRNGVNNVETRLIESQKVIKRLKESADRLLLDVPCSGLGVLKRHPDSKWSLTQDKISILLKTQEEILQNYSEMVKPGGQMVYATCSVLPSENQKQVERFLEKTAEKWQLAEELFVSPTETDFDGFYAARLVRSLS